MNTTQGVRITWPDGATVEARSATEFLLRTAEEQWTKTSHQGMKDQLSKRALAMGLQFIHPYQPDQPFLRELDRIGFIKVEGL